MKTQAQNIKPGQTIRVLSGRKVKVVKVDFLEGSKGHAVHFTMADGKAFTTPIMATINVAK